LVFSEQKKSRPADAERLIQVDAVGRTRGGDYQ